VPRSPVTQWLVGVVIVVVSVTVVIALVMLGSPREARIRRLDARRVSDLRDLSNAATWYRKRHDRLPASLDELALDPEARTPPRDPITGQRYEYRVLNPTTYEVCARFERATSDSSDQESGWANDLPAWRHDAGRQCFQREAKGD
jgi:type II secretory pathway pseudopilin PulG